MFVAVVNLCALVARWAASLFFVVVNADIIITPSIYMIYFEVYIYYRSRSGIVTAISEGVPILLAPPKFETCLIGHRIGS